MFTETGELRIGNTKYVLNNQLKVEVSERHIESQLTCSVIDGSAVLYVMIRQIVDAVEAEHTCISVWQLMIQTCLFCL